MKIQHSSGNFHTLFFNWPSVTFLWPRAYKFSGNEVCIPWRLNCIKLNKLPCYHQRCKRTTLLLNSTEINRAILREFPEPTQQTPKHHLNKLGLCKTIMRKLFYSLFMEREFEENMKQLQPSTNLPEPERNGFLWIIQNSGVNFKSSLFWILYAKYSIIALSTRTCWK